MIVDNSQTMTGDCHNADAECPEGFEWACCEIPGEFPTGMPSVSNCSMINVHIEQNYNFDYMIDAGDGILLVWLGLEGYVRKVNYVTLTTIWQSPSYNNGTLTAACLLSDGRIFTIVQGTGAQNNEHKILSGTTGSVVQQFGFRPGYYYYEYGHECAQEPTTGMVVITGRRFIIENTTTQYIGGFGIDLNTLDVVAEYFTPGIDNTTSRGNSSVAFHGGKVFIGSSCQKLSGLTTYANTGYVDRFEIDGTGRTTIATGVSYEYLGSKLSVTDKYLVVHSGYYKHGYKVYPYIIDGTNYCTLRTFDLNTMLPVDRIRDPGSADWYHGSPNGYGSCFGYGLSQYGNFILIGAPKADGGDYGRVHIYSSDFVYLATVSETSPLSDAGLNLGGSVLLTATHTYMVQSNYQGGGGNNIKVCEYSNTNL